MQDWDDELQTSPHPSLAGLHVQPPISASNFQGQSPPPPRRRTCSRLMAPHLRTAPHAAYDLFHHTIMTADERSRAKSYHPTGPGVIRAGFPHRGQLIISHDRQQLD